MKLVLFSGGGRAENRELAREAKALLRDKNNPTLTFVPWAGFDAAPEFRAFKEAFRGTGIRRLRCIPVDRKLSREEQGELFSSDAIFLGGGNTFYFLHQLRERRLLEKFRAFVARGGLLMGLSAGSILMTPSVRMAAVPDIDRDENEVGMRRLHALNLVPFEFSPHYEPCARADSQLLAHSRRVRHPIYACSDGEGIVVSDGVIRFIGKVAAFHRGRKVILQ
jgi:dipeptidase E